MTKGGTHSISRIRTFDDGVARAKGITPTKAPKLEKEKKTAQSIADATLKSSTHSATDFIGVTDVDTTIISETIVTPKKKPTKEKVSIPTPHNKKEGLVSSTPKSTVPAKQKISTHTLEEDIKKINTQAAPTTLSTEKIIYDASNNDFSEGTLVTNKKQHDFHLFSAIAASLHSWFTKTSTGLTKQKTPEHTISAAKTRIETITQAARTSKHAPTNDHGIVVKRLTKSTRKHKKNALTITNKEEVAAPQWSSAETTPALPPIPKSTISPIIVKTPIAPDISKKVPSVVSTPVPEVTVPLAQPSEIPPPNEKEKKVPLKKKKRKEKRVKKDVPQKKRTYRTTPSKIREVPIYVYLTVIVGASLLGIGVSVYWFMGVTSNEEISLVRIPSLFTADLEVSVSLGTGRGETLSTILEASAAARETIQIYPATTNESSIIVPVDAQTILNTLSLRAPGSFTRAIMEITFGSYNGTKPFILMKATNFDTAFGGMLAWEADMSADLSPLFGTPVIQSFDPYARTDTQIRSAFFRDTIVNNKSVRVLVDAQDNERLMYAFVTPTIILITPDTETFNVVLPLVTQ